MTGHLVFAFIAGTVASANPCGFALLPAFFLSYAASPEAPRTDPWRRLLQALLAGAAMTLAFALVFGGVGAAVGAGANALLPAIPWATIIVGAAFLFAGGAALTGRHLSIRLPDPVGKARAGYPGPFLFGVGYGVASLSCTLPVFLAVVGTSAAGIGPFGRAAVFLAYAAGMGTVLTALALGTALARGGVHRALRRLARHTPRISGGFLLVAGLYLIYYWTFFLLPGGERRTAGKGPIDVLTNLSSRLQNWFAAGGWVWGARVLVGLVVLFALLGLWRQARSRRHPSAQLEDLEVAPEREGREEVVQGG